MRLINTETLTLSEPRSHLSRLSRKRGLIKLQKLCELARQDGLQYAWADTCCIDKTGSSELTEAINSMFRFYLDADVCYAWLMDLPPDNRDIHHQLPKCRRFTRGWTLQELIAPRVLKFYDQTTEFLITNKGLRIDSGLFPVSDRIFFMDMNCVDFAPTGTPSSSSSATSTTNRRHIGILIKPHGGRIYSRVEARRFATPPGGTPLHGIRVFLPKHVTPSRSLYLETLFSYSFVFRRGVNPPT
ncbi:uncharacterized protein Triagg1_4534 [Trichoderma aggressivum f. europaeum]|uniref:Heterokaryon incompatibility domain-containing protein n=1 Tax=Trichoderma aggressivum f. europaeum TaxID=173218 RepID=A0AAE1IEL6_9HYPO|nr:hypothetical protein Triagg1_4534 [Trichoderma aggressivum f. europaeum]